MLRRSGRCAAEDESACGGEEPSPAEEMDGYRGRSGGESGKEEAEKESMMMELTRLVQKTVKESGWWERRGIDCSILAAAFLCLPPGKHAGARTHANTHTKEGAMHLEVLRLQHKPMQGQAFAELINTLFN